MYKYIYIHIYIYINKCSTLKFFDNIFIEDAMPEKAFRNELHAPFLPYFGTQHSICDFFYFILFVWGSQKSEKMFNAI